MAHYKLILRELSLQMPVLHGPDYVTLIANRLDLSEKTKREALRIYTRVQQNRISLGKNPRALAGAVIYLASQNCNEFLRQVEICQVADISTVSLGRDVKKSRLHWDLTWSESCVLDLLFKVAVCINIR